MVDLGGRLKQTRSFKCYLGRKVARSGTFGPMATKSQCDSPFVFKISLYDSVLKQNHVAARVNQLLHDSLGSRGDFQNACFLPFVSPRFCLQSLRFAILLRSPFARQPISPPTAEDREHRRTRPPSRHSRKGRAWLQEGGHKGRGRDRRGAQHCPTRRATRWEVAWLHHQRHG